MKQSASMPSKSATYNSAQHLLPSYYTMDEETLLDELVSMCRLEQDDHEKIRKNAHDYVSRLRSDNTNEQLIDKFLQEYGLSTPEGLTLMRLAEALIRTPDFGTGRKLIRDKLSGADWAEHARKSDDFWVNQATSGLSFTKQWIDKSGGVTATNLAARLGDRAMALGVARAMALMGEHFVLGRNIKDADKKAAAARSDGFTHSYDMLGEAAYTASDADRYYQAYLSAIQYLAQTAPQDGTIADKAGISVKLSALHPRYEFAKQADCLPVLTERLVAIAKVAKSKNLGLTIDAEEADRLELSLIVFDALLDHPDLADWDGLGIVIQSYQRRATRVITHVTESARKAKRKITVRLVKGAYWDMEIKRAQELGLSSYPVFTRKQNTDISYIACARLLLSVPDVIYPQFATHNALTASTIIYMAKDVDSFEFQRLHGMGEALYKGLMLQLGAKCRIYAPVGQHKDLLPYLVRRLLENGANSSFVNQLFDESISVDEIVESPFKLAQNVPTAANEHIPAPQDLFGGVRQSAKGLDITQSDVSVHLDGLLKNVEPYRAASLISGKPVTSKAIDVHSPSNAKHIVGTYLPANIGDIDNAIKAARASKWATDFTAEQRADCLDRAADQLETDMDSFLALCTLEAGKTYLDGVAEVREAVDFCRYYAQQARSEKLASRQALGTVACISPWNFPLAIFLGQVTASLSVGNTVIAKPAEQTPLIAHKAVNLLYSAGIPKDALHLVMGDGAVLGTHISAHSGIDGVCFTGSTATAKKIASSLAQTQRADLPFIAETGGINAMIIDSTALLEQAVQDIVISAFQSAGQRCSACRLVCVQEDIAQDFIEMLSGAMDALEVGDPAILSTDVGPIIDGLARRNIQAYVDGVKTKYKLIGQSRPSIANENGHYITPSAFEIASVSDVTQEVFGPILHVTRFKASEFETIVKQINAMGYGLTMGLHSRLDDRVEWLSKTAKAGNLYVNRNQIGAVVGVQPFGGEGLSGTGPKAGGPHYLLRLSSRSSAANSAADAENLSKDMPADISAKPQDVAPVIASAKQAVKTWEPQSRLEARKPLLKTAFANTSNLDVDFWKRLNCNSPETMQGPTGESNTLSLHARGVIICAGSVSDIVKQAALSLYAGNSVIAVPNTTQKDAADLASLNALSDTVNKTCGTPNLLQIADPSSLQSLLSSDIDGAAVDGDWRAYAGQHLCNRDGAILPLLSANSDAERFFTERTVSINTTAAGGNATLLTLS